jgi:hypothetical protein
MSVNCCAPHQTAHVISARRHTFSLQPATACPSPAPRMLRRCSAWRFASGFTARHGYHISVSVRVFALPKALRRCVPTEKRSPLPPRPTPAAADRPLAAIFHHSVCRLSCCSTLPYSSGGRLSFSVGRHLQAISIPIVGSPISSRLGNTVSESLPLASRLFARPGDAFWTVLL